MNVNNVTIIGNLVGKPETTAVGTTSVTKFTVALNKPERSDGNGGTIKPAPVFVDVESWGKAGEALAKHMDKGDQVAVVGEIDQSRWEDKQTKEKRSRTFVRATQPVQFGQRSKANQAAAAAAGAQS